MMGAGKKPFFLSVRWGNMKKILCLALPLGLLLLSAVAQSAPYQVLRFATNAAMLAEVNKYRTRPQRCGHVLYPAAKPLKWNKALRLAAYYHAYDMALYGYFDHVGRDGSTFTHRMARAGYGKFKSAAENIAAGTFDYREVVALWMQSPGHCRNIMDARLTEMGMAFSFNHRTNRIRWGQVFARP